MKSTHRDDTTVTQFMHKLRNSNPQQINIPATLIGRNQWVVWKKEVRPGETKPTKIPYCPRPGEGRKASSTSVPTWGRYADAVTTLTVDGYDGIGYVLTLQDGLVFVDLDNCRNAETGEIEQWAWDIVLSLNSYTELSPSGTGLHIFARGVLPEGRRKSKQVEMYCDKRFATVTGLRVEGTPSTIEDRPAELLALHHRTFGVAPPPTSPVTASQNGQAYPTSLSDEEIVERASRAANGAKFRTLWSGDTSGYPSASEADQALCSLLVFWTQDPTQVERVMRQSGLAREKWDTNREYLPRSIRTALRGIGDTYSIPTGELSKARESVQSEKSNYIITYQSSTNTHVADNMEGGIPGVVCMANVEPERVRWLWRGRIPLGKLTIIDGDPGLGKSVITCDLAARVSSGRAMPDGTFGDLDGPSGVVILSAEDGLADTIRPRLDAAGAECERIAALTYVVDKTEERLPTLADLHEISRSIAATEASLVIVDPLMAYLQNETNSYRDQDVRRALTPLSKLAESTGVAMVVVRHLNKSSIGNPIYRGGGSIGIIGAARAALLVAPDPDDESGLRRILAVTKSNLATMPSALSYTIEDNGADMPIVVWGGATSHTAKELLAAANDGEGGDARSDAEGFLLDALEDGSLPVEDLLKGARNAGIAETTLRRAKKKLGVKAGKIGFGADGRWRWRLPNKTDDAGALL